MAQRASATRSAGCDKAGDRATVTAATGGFDKRTGREPAAGHGERALLNAVCGVLVDPAAVPGAADLLGLARHSAIFDVTDSDAARGFAEVMCDGMLFDCLGLAPAPVRRIEGELTRLGLPEDFACADHALVTLAPAAQLQGLGQLLPVVRAIAALAAQLGTLPGARAVVWLPARQVTAPRWFADAVDTWLEGGPFPALALTALTRTAAGFESRGLAFFTGQEFVLAPRSGDLRQDHARGAVRLTDWLVAHGPIGAPCTVELSAFGTVELAPDATHRVVARCD